MTMAARIWDVVNPFILAIVLLFLISAIFTMIMAQVTGNLDYTQALQEMTVSPLVVNIAFYGISILVFGRLFRRDHLRFGLPVFNWSKKKAVLVIILASAACIGFNFLLVYSPLVRIFPGYQASAQASFVKQPLVLLILSNVLLGPAAEELIFRGLICRRGVVQFSLWPAVILSAALFGLYHGNMLQFIYALGIGIVLGLCREKSGSILVTILIHMIINAFAIPWYL